MLGYQRTDEHWFQMPKKFKVVHVCIMLQDDVYINVHSHSNIYKSVNSFY